ncbi:universal stress protein [Arthrobacter sunyaminii]|uniref:universal stress protein n=1 Tax=Arthrobacter sunyaminii TaxID=2816859 RepID=UPI001A940DF1|nr:universal stress protein [Arthrobacter sunyaminii]MBO0895180.1 universal stress protein [Arthrobacter sunyaminii]
MTDSSSFTIVVGVDGSPDSRLALEWAADEARLRNGRLQLITAWSKPPLAWYPEVLETAAGGIAVAPAPEEDAGKLNAEALKFAADKGAAATGRVVHNHSPAAAIVDAAREADLIVVGARGYGGFEGLHLGAVSHQVVNHAHCPVLIFRPKAA